jgi:hypothetical protein
MRPRQPVSLAGALRQRRIAVGRNSVLRRMGFQDSQDKAYPVAAGERKRRNRLLYSGYELEPVMVKQTDHYKFMQGFCEDPTGFVEAVMED